MTKAARPPSPVRAKPARKQQRTPSLPYLVKYRERLPGIARPAGKMTQADLAHKTGFSQGMISQWEKGDSDVPLQVVHMLAAALDITPEQLLFRDPDKGEHVSDIWEKIPQEDHPKALRVLRGFLPDGKNN